MKDSDAHKSPYYQPHSGHGALVLVVSALVGAGAAFAATGFSMGLELVSSWIASLRAAPWQYVFFPGLGAGLAWLVTHFVFHEPEGHGVPKVIASVCTGGGRISPKAIFSGLIASLLTIASGGSAGPEAPIVASGAALGSNVARIFRFDHRLRETLVGCGAAGGIAAIFNAPVTGMIFSVEVIMGEWSAFNLVPIAITSVVAAELTRVLRGDIVPFVAPYTSLAPRDFLALFIMVLCSTLISVGLMRGLRGIKKGTKLLRIPQWLSPVAGGLLVGVIGFWLPDALGEGYQTIQHTIHSYYGDSLLFLFLLALAKLLATCLTLGSGGAGGIFAPCLVIGSLSGLTFYRVATNLWPHCIRASESSFALLGMAAIVGGVMQAPLTAIFLIMEITGGYHLSVSVIAVAFTTAFFTRMFEPASFYLRDLVETGKLLRPRTDARVLADLKLVDVLSTDRPTVPSDMKVSEFIEFIAHHTESVFPVLEAKTGKCLGLIEVRQARPGLWDQQTQKLTVDNIISHKDISAQLTSSVDTVLRAMQMRDAPAIPILDDSDYVGLVTEKEIFAAYRNKLIEASEEME